MIHSAWMRIFFTGKLQPIALEMSYKTKWMAWVSFLSASQYSYIPQIRLTS